MIDYKNYKADKPVYSLIHMIRDGVGVMVIAIAGYLIACGAFAS